MAKDYATLPYNEVRRTDRAVEDDEWIKALLRRAPMATIATVGPDGQPFINSNLFVYDEANHCVYIHTFRLGRTRSNVEAEERVCLSVSEMGRLLPADAALEFSVEYSGLAVFGKAVIVADPEQATYGLQLLLDKYFPQYRPERDYRPIQPEELARTAVYRIEIESWSGKRKQVAEDFPGAFAYPAEE